MKADVPVLTVTADETDSYRSILSWNAVEGAVKYEIYRSTKSSKSYKLVATVETLTYGDDAFAAGTAYYYKVKAVTGDGVTSDYSNRVYRTCDLARPEISIALSSGKPKVSWKKVSGATEYEVYRATSKTGTYTRIYTTTKTSLTNTSATKGTTYYYKVRAICDNSAAASAYSAVKYIKSK